MAETFVHALRLFTNEAQIVESCCDFVTKGHELGDAILIATEKHRAARIRGELITRGYADCAAGAIFLDAEAVADGLLMEGVGAAFEWAVGQHVRRAAMGSRRGVTAYGDIVNVLWERGRITEALELEGAWEALLTPLRARLLCGYRVNPLDPACLPLVPCHGTVVGGRELERLERAVHAALGGQIDMVQVMVAGDPLLRRLPFGQAAALWMREHVPVLAARMAERLGDDDPSAFSAGRARRP